MRPKSLLPQTAACARSRFRQVSAQTGPYQWDAPARLTQDASPLSSHTPCRPPPALFLCRARLPWLLQSGAGVRSMRWQLNNLRTRLWSAVHHRVFTIRTVCGTRTICWINEAQATRHETHSLKPKANWHPGEGPRAPEAPDATAALQPHHRGFPLLRSPLLPHFTSCLEWGSAELRHGWDHRSTGSSLSHLWSIPHAATICSYFPDASWPAAAQVSVENYSIKTCILSQWLDCYKQKSSWQQRSSS